MEKSVFVDFASRVIQLEKDKKEIGDEIKDSVAAFAENNGMNKKSVAKAVKEYKNFLKDSQEFTEVDNEVAQIINDVVYAEITK